ncbi:MAG TPA: ABC transporter permease [Polaromonas sp.]|jgi:osmoprotectant transport system permease protein
MLPGLKPRSIGVMLITWAAGLGVLWLLARQLDLAGMLRTYGGDIAHLVRQHLALAALSGGLAIVTGVPLGIALSRQSAVRFSEAGMQFLNIGATIPTLAILALSMSWLGIGTQPAVFALWAVTLLPIVRNTIAGLRGVEPYLIEAGRGMGMTPLQLLIQVELPNALYVILAGVRTALAINVGTVPLAFLIGGGGLGELIFTGIDLNEPTMMLAGALPTAGLAVIVDFSVSLIAYYLVPRGVNPQR